MYSKKVIVALDNNNLQKSLELVKILKQDVFAFKLGYEFFFNFGLIGYKKIYRKWIIEKKQRCSHWQ